jgi:hypothetical protein
MKTENEPFAMIRAVKALSEDLQKQAKSKKYKSNDIVFITRDSKNNYIIQEKIEGSIVEWQIKNGLLLKK